MIYQIEGFALFGDPERGVYERVSRTIDAKNADSAVDSMIEDLKQDARPLQRWFDAQIEELPGETYKTMVGYVLHAHGNKLSLRYRSGKWMLLIEKRIGLSRGVIAYQPVVETPVDLPHDADEGACLRFLNTFKQKESTYVDRD